jgi:alpha-tubulin suppressor-like RCC1 family protein
MGRATVGAAGVATAAMLLSSVGPAGSPLLLTETAGAATRSAPPMGAAAAASSAVKVTAVAGGLYHDLALSSAGAVFAWGWNIAGQLCSGSTNGSDFPVKVRPLDGTKVTGIAAGFAHSLAVTSTGAVLACGGNNFGQLGDGSYKGSEVPVKVNLQGFVTGLTATRRLAPRSLRRRQ